jgi:hypothetical protein
MTRTKILSALIMILSSLCTGAFAQGPIDEVIVTGNEYIPVNPNAYVGYILSSAFYRPPQPFNNNTPAWVVEQCKTNANIAARTCENKAISDHTSALGWCDAVASIPQVALDATVGIADESWISWLGGALTITGGVTTVDGATYLKICMQKKQNDRDEAVNECLNDRDKKCQRS